MSEQQLWLFSQPKPLRERLGDDFFRQVPPLPGIYLMHDGRERVLYVGQSGNLRQRLNSYKNIRPETHPRKLVRLAAATEGITWETCDTPEAAQLRENQLLRHLRPKFNRANTRPEAYGYIGFRASGVELELWLTNEMSSSPELYGAFKGQRRVAYCALLRVLGQVRHAREPIARPPDTFMGARWPSRATVLWPEDGAGGDRETLPTLMRQYLEGESSDLVDALRSLLPPPDSLPLFWQQVQALDFETLQDFYERGPARNSRLRAAFQIPARVIAPAELDDLLVRFKVQG